MVTLEKLSSLPLVLFALLFVIRLATSEISPKIDWVYIPYAALGKTVSSSEEKLGFRLMPETEVMRNKEVIYTQFTSTKYAMVDSNEDASDLLDIKGALMLKLNIGVVSGSADGTGSYLHESGDRSQYSELLFVAKVIKKFEVLKNIEFLATKAQCERAKQQQTTHVITGITYGGQCIISCRIRTSGSKNKEKINAQVKATLGLTNITLNADGALKLHNALQNRFENVTVKTYCNANLKNAPTNLADAVGVVSKSLSNIQEQNSLGVPISMELTPLTQFPSCQSSSSRPNPAYFDIYLEGLSAMVDDLRTSRTLLFQCIEAYPLDKSKAQLLQEIQDMDTNLKDVHLKLTTKMLTVSQIGNANQFLEFDKIYANNDDKTRQKIWNHKFWAMRVHSLCYRMRENKMLKEIEKSVQFKSFAIVQKCIFNRNMLDKRKILSSRGLAGHAAAEALSTKCFKTSESKSRAFWMARIYRPDYINEIQVINHGVDFYLSKDPLQFRLDYDISKFHQVYGHIDTERRLENAVVLIKARSSAPHLEICDLKVLGGPCSYDRKNVKN